MIRFENVSYEINGKKILNNLSFEVKKNSILAIIGQSGGGKTSIANILMRKIKDYTGSVYIYDKNLKDYSEKEYFKLVSIVLQDYTTALNPRMSVRDVLIEPFEIKKEKIDERKIIYILELLRLDKLDINIKVSYLSGGEKQRLNIARILLFNPEVLIFDESISSLDIDLQMEIVSMIKDISIKMDKTIIFITHNTYILKFLTEDILVMRQGNIVERVNVISEVKNEYTKLLIDVWKKSLD